MDATRQAELLESVSFDYWEGLASELTERSERICANNDCTEEQHGCESCAYISADGELHDICCSDYWQGWGELDLERHGEIAAIPLPWIGKGQDLKAAIDSELCWYFE